MRRKSALRRRDLKKFVQDYFWLAVMVVIIVSLDQWTKNLVQNNIPFGDIWSPWDWLTPYARIVHWRNTGAAFGILQGFGGIFTILAIVVSLAILYYYPQVPREDWPLRFAMGLQLSGAIGNLINRLTLGYVIDFVSVGNFPVFNIADASISTGTAVLILGMWLRERGPRTDDQQDSETAADTFNTPPVEETGGE